MRHILRVVYEKISPMMKTSGKGNYSRWPKEIEYSAQFSEDGSILVEVNTETLPDFLIRKDLINKSPSKSPEQSPTPAPPEPEQTPEQLNH